MMESSEDKIRPIVITAGLFIASMLFQTSSSSLGTIVAMITILLCIVSYFFEYGLVIRMTRESYFLLFFWIYASAVSIFRSGLPPYYTRLSAQIILCSFLLGTDKANKREEKYLVTMFVASSIFYSIYGIVSSFGSTRYYHGDVILFGTEIDPNFFGIPLVASSAFFLYQFLNGKKYKFFCVVGYLIVVTGIMMTASRGNFLGLIVADSLVILDFIFNREIGYNRKIIYSAVSIIFACIIFSFIQNYFIDAWTRMTSIGSEGSDNGRFELWNYALQQWLKHPILGGGMYSNFLNNGSATHNTYIQVLSETGIVGFAVYFGFIIQHIRNVFSFNKIYVYIFIGMMTQIAFLDALDCRAVWSIICLLALMPFEKRENCMDNVIEDTSDSGILYN